MRLLITGSGGFVGKNLKENLSKEIKILAPRSAELDLTDYEAVEKYLELNNVTHVVHAAVSSGLSISRDEGFQGDLRMLISLTRNINKLNKLIVFGSGAEFAKTREMRKVSEEEWGKYVPEDLYGLSKFLSNEIVRREPKMFNLRLFGIYGPHENYKYKFISNSIIKNLLGMPITIKQDVIFDYLYISDLVPVVEYFLDNETEHQDYNISTTNSIKISKIVKIINEIAEKPSKMIVVNQGLNYEYTGNNERLRQALPSWKITSYRDGIKLLYKYYQKLHSEGELDVEAIEKDDFLQRSKIKNSKAK